ncbi:MAG: EAL domain-containing protein [Rhodoferax sp.]|nr:EAL domain-containing protein [Rhodoferax sp.]
MKVLIPNFSIRSRLLLLVMVFVLPFMAVLMVEMAGDLDEARDSGYQRVKALADGTAIRLAQILSDETALMERLAERSALQALDPTHCDPVLQDHVSLHPEFTALGIFDTQGRSVCMVGHGSQEMSRVDELPWFKEGLQRAGFHASDAVLAPHSGRWVSVLTYPLRQSAGQVSGLLALPLDLEKLSQRELTAIAQTALLSVYDRNHHILMRSSEPHVWIGQAIPGDFVRQKAGKSEGYIKTQGVDGIERLFAFASVPGSGWQVVAGLQERDVLSGYHALRKRILLLSVALLALTLALGWQVGRSIVRPVQELADVVARVTAGDADARVSGKGPQELQKVARKLNQMLDVGARVESERQTALAALRESQERYQNLVDSSPIGIGVYRDGIIIYANPASVSLMGAQSAQQLVGRPILDLVHPDFRALAMERIRRAVEHGEEARPIEEKFLRLDGQTIDVEVQSTPILFEGLPAVRVSFNDISERKAADRETQLSASVFTHAREAIMITDANGTILKVNQSFSRITGYSAEEVVGKNPRFLKSGHHSLEFYSAMWNSLLEQGHWTGEIWNRRKDGKLYAEMQTVSAVREHDGSLRHFVALFTDITSIKEHEQQLEHIAHFDPLTNLPNRVLLADRLRQAMSQSQRRAQSLAVAYLDLDGFKEVNDSYGHDVGDKLLVALSQRMKAALRESDTLARIGGDEFVAVLVDLEQPRDCEPILTRLLRAAADRVPVDNVPMQVSASIGVTLYPQDGSDADLLMRHADQAMYQAKQGGKNCFHLFDVAHDDAIKTQRQSMQAVREAFEQQQFVLFYQPKVNMKTGLVVGVEALIRWQHPERGLLPPAAFLPVIEDDAMSVEVGEWVIASALSQVAAWSKGGLDLPVSVNIGARQLQQPGFAERLQHFLATYPLLSPSRLELEVLETSALEDMAQVSEVMHACKDIGVLFALDDFGTGYSSLTYLKRLPADLLKIDQSFVRDMLVDSDDLAIVHGIVGLAAAFQRQVIAEGVETRQHGEMLASLGCELAQGYGIARPMPASEVPNWVANWQTDPLWTA